MSAKFQIELLPFPIPSTVVIKMPMAVRQDGFNPAPTIRLIDLDASVLAELCDDFRRGVFVMAGKVDPGLCDKGVCGVPTGIQGMSNALEAEPQTVLPETPYVLVDMHLSGKLRCRVILPGQGLPKDINNIPKKDEERIMRELELWKADPNRNLERCAPTYRLLEAGEVIQEGDEFWDGLVWEECVLTGHHVGAAKFRRKL